MKVESLDFRRDSSISDNGRVYYSGNDYYGDDGLCKTEYATLEQDYWLLDGKKKLLPQSSYAQQPLISNKMTNASKTFTTQPKITIDAESSGLEYNLLGINIIFDTLENDYATEFDVKCYLDGTLKKTINWENSVADCDMTEGTENIDKIEIIFKKMNKPNRRLRITRIFLGLLVRYTNQDIIETTQKWEIDLLSREITDNSFKIKVDNSTSKYNADNPEGISQYIQEQQPVEINYYYELTGNKYEQISGGTLYLTGKPKAEKYNATFEAKGKVYFLNDIYKKGIYNENGTTYRALLEDLFEQANITKYSIDDSQIAEDNSKTTIPLPMLPIKELIQLICNATNRICIEDREGHIRIVPKSSTVQNYYLDLNNQREFPVVDTQEKLKNVNVAYYTPDVLDETTQIYRGEYSLIERTVLQIEYTTSPATNCSVAVRNGTVNSQNFYAYYCELDITPTGGNTKVLVTISGKEIELSKNTYTLNVNLDGENCDINNPLVDSSECAGLVATNFKNYLQNRNIYTSDNRGEPIWDSSDNIKLETKFAEEKNVAITSNEITFNGGLSGKTTFRSLGG